VYSYERTDPQLAPNRAVRRAMELHRPLIYYLIGLDSGLYQVVHPSYVTAEAPAALTLERTCSASIKGRCSGGTAGDGQG
jgi:hypothetical protein